MQIKKQATSLLFFLPIHEAVLSAQIRIRENQSSQVKEECNESGEQMPKIDVAYGVVDSDACSESGQTGEQQCPPDPACSPANPPKTDQQDSKTIRDKGTAKTGPVVGDQGNQPCVDCIQHLRCRTEIGKVLRNKHPGNPDQADHQPGGSQAKPDDDKTELPPQCKLPVPVIVELCRQGFQRSVGFAAYGQKIERKEKQPEPKTASMKYTTPMEIIVPAKLMRS